jgi:ATP-dependent DNA helicase RecG
MHPYTDTELTALLDNLESEQVERKAAWAGDALKKVPEALCAFANDLPDSKEAGVVFVGAHDDGTPSGLVVDDQLLITLANLKADGRTTPPSLSVQKRRLKNADMAVVFVSPSDSPPVRFEGNIWVRTGPRRSRATAQEERILNEKTRFRGRAFDAHPLRDCALSELDREFFENQYLPQAISAEALEANSRTCIERLASTQMIASSTDECPTVLGLLTLGRNPRTWVPGAYVQFVRFQGTDSHAPVRDAQEIDGSLSAILRRLDDKLKANINVAVDFTSAIVERRQPDYPLAALQQLVRNALMHRTYENTNAPVRLHWYEDRIEIVSPGGPFDLVSKENFGTPGATDYRNPGIATALKNLGFVQKFGAGIPLAQKTLQDNGNPPLQFEVQPTLVTVTVRSKPSTRPV